MALKKNKKKLVKNSKFEILNFSVLLKNFGRDLIAAYMTFGECIWTGLYL